MRGCIHTHTHTYTHPCIHTYTCTHICTDVHKYMHTYIKFFTIGTPTDETFPLLRKESEGTDDQSVMESNKCVSVPTTEQCEHRALQKQLSTASMESQLRRNSPLLTPRHLRDPKAGTRFHKKQRKGTIDVYWLFDDGGMLL